MSRRRKRKQEHVNHERWIVSYADFITLLFAFFVVMYSVSSVNEGKYRVLSQTLTDAFQETRRSLEPIQVGELSRNPGDSIGFAEDNAVIQTERIKGPGSYQEEGLNLDKLGAMPKDEVQRLSFLAATIEDMLSDYVDQDLVEVTFTEDRVIVNMKDKMLFPSASANLSSVAVNALRSISRVLKTVPNQIQVEGNTDDRPINNEEFPSNWELSAARAASVVHLMSRMGVNPQRLSAVGYAEHRPVADNTTETGRAKNRRVSLVIMGMNAKENQVIDLPTGER
jgi:chemotaxis protein MotB